MRVEISSLTRAAIGFTTATDNSHLGFQRSLYYLVFRSGPVAANSIVVGSVSISEVPVVSLDHPVGS